MEIKQLQKQSFLIILLFSIMTIKIKSQLPIEIFVKNFNNTHFTCDKGNNILDYERLNDDSCDCEDGSDENSK